MNNERNESSEAVAEVQQRQLEHIRNSIKQAEAGQLIDHSEVRKMADGWAKECDGRQK